jgi:glycosyltransferase involved in cell wall biosynthesis
VKALHKTMKLSVILCTYNRSGILPKALDGIAGQVLSKSDDWEVLVVDNNSSDQTRNVVKEYCRRYPDRFRYLFEAQQGLSHARNTGIKHAQGDVLVFVDDDVTITPTWLRNLVAQLRDGRYAGAGGRILPDWTCEAPPWLATDGRYALAPFAVFDLGPEAGPLLEPPLGANMAFRKAMFACYGNFRADLGRSGTGMLSNEDTEFGRRLLKAGEALHYEASAVVYHPVSQDRLQKSYLLKWSFAKGRSDIREFGPRAGTRYYFRGVPLYLFRNLARGLLCWTLSLDPRRRFQYKSIVWGKLGAIVECYHASQPAIPGLESNAPRSVVTKPGPRLREH